MKIGIYYFSGTGNSEWVSRIMEEVFQSKNHEILRYSIEENPSVKDLDLLIVGGPIYAGNVPEKLIRWLLRNVPDTNACKAIVFSTSVGLQNANGTISLGKKLKKKGYQVIGQYKYQLPRNFYFTNYGPTDACEIPTLFENAKNKIEKDIETIKFSNSLSISDKTLGMDLAAEMMSLMTRFMGKHFSIANSCIRCGLCEKNCPTENIQLDTNKQFKFKCMMCTRCIHNCPVNAIRYKEEQFYQYQIKKELL